MKAVWVMWYAGADGTATLHCATQKGWYLDWQLSCVNVAKTPASLTHWRIVGTSSDNSTKPRKYVPRLLLGLMQYVPHEVDLRVCIHQCQWNHQSECPCMVAYVTYTCVVKSGLMSVGTLMSDPCCIVGVSFWVGCIAL